MFFKYIKERIFSIQLKKIVIIFLFGLFFRFFINSIFDINVFKDYLNKESILYFLGLASFSVTINELKEISVKGFVSYIRLVGKHISDLYFPTHDYMYDNGKLHKYSPKDKVYKELKPTNVLFSDRNPEGVSPGPNSNSPTGTVFPTGPGTGSAIRPVLGDRRLPGFFRDERGQVQFSYSQAIAINNPPVQLSTGPVTERIIPYGYCTGPNGEIIPSLETKKSVHDILKPITEGVKNRNPQVHNRDAPNLSKILIEYGEQKGMEERNKLTKVTRDIINTDPALAHFRGKNLGDDVQFNKVGLGPRTLFNKRLRNE